MARRISFARGKGNLRHNNRDFISKNVDKSRISENITLVKQDLDDAYREIFGDAQAAYNAKQKRNDRKIDDYFEKLFGRPPSSTIIENSNKQQSFYEWVIGVGDMHDTGFESNPEMAKIATECLKEYVSGFNARNPKIYIFNAVIHQDEKTPHLHLDGIPFADGYKKGMTRQQSISKALEQMGYGEGEQAIANFTKTERRVFREICEAHGIEIAEEQIGRGETLTCEAYREYAETCEKNEKLKAENDKLSEEKDVKIKQTISDFATGKGAKKVAAAEKIIENAETLNAANVEKEKQLNEREQALKVYASEQERKAQNLTDLQRATEDKVKALESDRKELITEKTNLENEKKSVLKVIAIKARQLADKFLRSIGIRTNKGFDVDSQARLALTVQRDKERHYEYNRDN